MRYRSLSPTPQRDSRAIGWRADVHSQCNSGAPFKSLGMTMYSPTTRIQPTHYLQTRNGPATQSSPTNDSRLGPHHPKLSGGSSTRLGANEAGTQPHCCGRFADSWTKLSVVTALRERARMHTSCVSTTTSTGGGSKV